MIEVLSGVLAKLAGASVAAKAGLGIADAASALGTSASPA